MAAIFLKIVLKLRWLILVSTLLLTAGLLVVIVQRGRLVSILDDFLQPQIRAEFEQIRQDFDLPRAASMTIAAPAERSLLDLDLLQEQSEVFAEVEKRWPVHVMSIATIMNKHLQQNNPEKSLANLTTQGAVNKLLLNIYKNDPEEFKRIIPASFVKSNTTAMLSFASALDELFPGLISGNILDLPKVEYLRAGVELEENLDIMQARETVGAVRDFLNERSDSIHYRLFSNELIGIDNDELIRRNNVWVALVMVLLLGVVLYWMFRRWIYTLFPIVLLLVTLVITYGLLVIGGYDLINGIAIIPVTLLLGQCIDNLIHFNERFREELAQVKRRAALLQVIRTSGRAALVTTLINVMAFVLDVLTTQLQPIKLYSYVIILGLSFALVLTYTSGLAFLASVPEKWLKGRTIRQQKNADTDYIRGQKYFAWLYRRRRPVLAGALLFFLAMIFLTTRVDTRYRMTSYMSARTPTYQAYVFEQEKFAVFVPHYVLIAGDVKSPRSKEALDAVEATLQSRSDIEKIDGEAKLVSVNHLTNKYTPESMPQDWYQKLQALEKSTSKADGVRLTTAQEEFKHVVSGESGDYAAMLVTFWPKLTDSEHILSINKDIEKVAQQFPDYRVAFAGTFASVAISYETTIFWNVILGIATTVAIGLALLLAFRSFKIGAIAVIPIFFGLVVGMGLLPLLNVELNALNGTIVVLAMGLGIDYSVQVMTRFREEYARRRDKYEAWRETMGRMVFSLGRAALLTSAGLFVLAGIMPLTGKFGVAAGSAILTAYAAAITVVPLLAVRFVNKASSPTRASKT